MFLQAHITTIKNKDETTIVVASGDGIYRYYAQLNSLIAAACERAPRNLTRAEWSHYMPSEMEYRATCPYLPIEDE
jgi:hypothetical protein